MDANSPNDPTTASPASGLRWGLRIHLTLWIVLGLVALFLGRDALFPETRGAVWLAIGALTTLAVFLWLPGRLGDIGWVAIHSLSFACIALVGAEFFLERTSESAVAHTRYPYPYRMHGFAPNIEPGDSERHRQVSTNSSGLRGAEDVGPKTPGTFRIVVLGGSTIFGVNNTDEETPPAWLERLLQERHAQTPFAGVERIEVVNGGQGWYNSTQELIFLVTELALYEPDLVIAVDGYNDLHHALVWKNRPPSNQVSTQTVQQLLNLPGTFTEKGWDHALHEAVGVSALAERLQISGDAVVALRSTSEIENRTPRAPRRKELFDLVKHRLIMNWTLIDRLGESFGFQTLFALQPVIFEKEQPADREVRWMKRFKATEDITAAWSDLRAWAEQETSRLGIDYFDSDVYVRKEANAIFWDYCHLDKHGSRLLAQAIADRVSLELEREAPATNWDGVRYPFDAGDPIWRVKKQATKQ